VTQVLVTGATGFLGGAITAHLLREYPAVSVIAAARARDGHSAHERVLASVRRFEDTQRPYGERLTTVSFDLIGTKEPHAKLPATTHVVHCALDASGSPLANLRGTLALANQVCEHGRCARFLYVGSAWSCGRVTEGLVHENDPSIEALFPYLAEKAATEHALGAIPGFPLVVVRPSLVLGHTVLGARSSASLFWVLRLIHEMASLPWSRQRRVDVVPVDWVATAVSAMLFATAPPPVVHLSAGEETSVRWADIEAVFCRTEGTTRQWIESPLSRSEWSRAAAAKVLPDASHAAETLDRCLRFFEGDVRFDTLRAREAGITSAPALTAYLDTCLRVAATHDLTAQWLDDAM
jgi:nucleoside-diphosphate-sugar epimerase